MDNYRPIVITPDNMKKLDADLYGHVVKGAEDLPDNELVAFVIAGQKLTMMTIDGVPESDGIFFPREAFL